MIPLLEGDTPQTNGEQEFADLSEAEQREILGNAKFEAYRSGDIVLLEDLVKVKSRNKWGTQRTEDGLIAALGKDLARQYTNGETFDTFDGELYRAERRIVDREYEVGLAFDDQNRAVWRDRGAENFIERERVERIPENTVVTHNHPFDGKGSDGGTFSINDIVFASRKRLREIRIITRSENGNIVVYSMSSTKWPEPDSIEKALQLWLQRAKEELSIPTDNDKIGIIDMHRAYHLAWTKLSAMYSRLGFGMKYHRKEFL